jgi:uncharacterized protein YndB with AHSA1/START domain/catechol 2,3-dioxygenase-like lactoylglutathione lyase family enzyme
MSGACGANNRYSGSSEPARRCRLGLTVTTPGAREIVLAREFDAPRRLVFDAFTRPELLVRWYGARGWNLTECEIDLRVGGAWRFVSRGPGGAVMGQRGVYREIVAPQRLVYTELFDDQSYPGETLIDSQFTEHGGRTTVTTTVRYATPQGRDTALRYPMERGVGEAYDRLDEILTKERIPMNWTLEVVIVPVSDIDRAKEFYSERLGFNVDHDTRISEGNRIVQLTPPGSGCSIVIGEGLVPPMEPGSIKGLQLVVPDIKRAHKELVERGVKVTEVQVMGESPTPTPDPLDNVGFVFFDDPDGNSWGVQQISTRG